MQTCVRLVALVVMFGGKGLVRHWCAAMIENDRDGWKQGLCSLTSPGGRMGHMWRIIATTIKPFTPSLALVIPP